MITENQLDILCGCINKVANAIDRLNRTQLLLAFDKTMISVSGVDDCPRCAARDAGSKIEIEKVTNFSDIGFSDTPPGSEGVG